MVTVQSYLRELRQAGPLAVAPSSVPVRSVVDLEVRVRREVRHGGDASPGWDRNPPAGPTEPAGRRERHVAMGDVHGDDLAVPTAIRQALSMSSTTRGDERHESDESKPAAACGDPLHSL